jgi:hypothetical protein
VGAGQYVNLVNFPVPLHFRESALGSRRNVIVGSAHGRIVLPLSNLSSIAEPFSVLRAPPVRDIDFAVRVHDNGRDAIEHLRWGGYFTWNAKDLANTAVASVGWGALAFPATQNGVRRSLKWVSQMCLDHAPDWSARLADWIEVLTGADLDATHPLQGVFEGPRWNSSAWINRMGSKRSYEYVNPIGIAIGSTGDDALDPAKWSTAIRGANTGVRPPETLLLIRDARAAQRRRNGRRAVLDAATAVELIIEPALRTELLLRNPQTFVDHLLKAEWSFSNRAQLMSSLGMWLPPNLASNVMDLRNKVIHANATVGAREANVAIVATTALAARYVPMSLP